MAFLPMVGKLAMKLAVRAAPQLYRYALTWAPYYAVKFSAYYTVKRYGVPRIYRALLRANKRLTPPRQQAEVAAAIQLAARFPGQAFAALEQLDGFLTKVVTEGGERSELPEHVLSDIQSYMLWARHDGARELEARCDELAPAMAAEMASLAAAEAEAGAARAAGERAALEALLASLGLGGLPDGTVRELLAWKDPALAEAAPPPSAPAPPVVVDGDRARLVDALGGLDVPADTLDDLLRWKRGKERPGGAEAK